MVGLVALLFAAYEAWVSPLSEAKAQRALLVEFQSLAATSSGPQAVYVKPGSPVGIVQIPTIQLTAVVVEGVTATALKSGPGHLPGSPLPGQLGNVVIAGRRTTYGSPFRHLDHLRQGSSVYTTTLQGRFEYVVTDVLRVGPGDADVLGSTKDARLTLVTSDPAYVPSGRLVAVAEIRDRALLPTLSQPASAFGGSTALGGDSGALAAVVLWLEVAALCLVGTLWLYRRRVISRVAAYVITTPILLAVLFMLFGSLDRLLPATL